MLRRAMAATLLGLLWVSPGPAVADETYPTAHTQGHPKLPPRHWPTHEDWYGPQAKRLGIEGRVLVAFDIATDGKPDHVSVLWSENDLLAKQTEHLLSELRFDVPKDWAMTGGTHRWYAGFVYRLSPSGLSGEFAVPVEKIEITGTRLPGAPVRSRADSDQKSH
jgi:hypothetical protein